MRARHLLAFLIFIMPAAAWGQSPWYLSTETGGDYGCTTPAFSADNEITFGRKFTTPINFFIEAGNRVGYEAAWSDELSLGAGLNFFDHLALSLHAVCAPAPEFDFYLKPALKLSWEFEDAGLSVKDANEFSVYVLSGGFEYENLLDCDLSFDVARKSFLTLGASNDFRWDGEISEVIKPNAGFESERFGMKVSYGLSLSPALAHSIGIELAYSIGDEGDRRINLRLQRW